MKKYPFPAGVTQMSGPDYAQHCATMAAKEAAEKAARAARRAEVSRPGPTPTIAALAVGASHTFTHYKRTSQLSSALRGLYIRTGARYTSSLARDLMNGDTVIGVTVKRIE